MESFKKEVQDSMEAKGVHLRWVSVLSPSTSSPSLGAVSYALGKLLRSQPQFLCFRKS